MNKIDAIDKETFVKKVLSLNNERHKFVDELNKKYAKMMIRDIEQIIRTEIDYFYEDYDPRSYQRYGSLYNIFDIDIDVERHKMSIDIDSQYMKSQIDSRQRRLSNEGIFHNSLELGWHGGAIPKDQNARTIYGNQVIPNTPYWRRSFSARYWRYTHWYKPAQIMDGEPPIQRIEERVRKYIREKNKEFNIELQKYNDDFHKKIIRLAKGYIKEEMEV